MQISFQDFHKAFDHKVRLGIMSALMVNDQLDFNSLIAYLKVSDGNLATHIKRLEKEAFIGVEKSFIDRKPNTSYFITKEGRAAFEKHLSVLEKIIQAQK